MIFYNKKFLNVAKKIAVFFVCVFYFLTAHNAQAQVVTDILVGENTTIMQAQMVARGIEDSAKFSWDIVRKNLLDTIAYSAGQKLLTQLTNSTVKWIQGGFHGDVSFAVNWDNIGKEIADSMAGDLVLKLRGIRTCKFTTTYTDDLEKAVYKEPKKYDYIFDNEATCPFTENIGFTSTDFYMGLNKLTWDAYGAMLADSGNPYGVQTITAKELQKKTADAKAKKERETSWSNGFTDIKDLKNCNFPPELFQTVAPDVDTSGVENEGDMQNALDVQEIINQHNKEAEAENAQRKSDPEFARKHQQYCDTTTPGKIMSDQLTKSFGVDFDRLGFADNMNKIVSVFLDHVMQKTVRSVFGKGNKSYDSPVVGEAYTGLGANACLVQVTTLDATARLDATTNSGSAEIKGSVACADTVSNANVSVWFRWSDVPFVGDSRSANLESLPENTLRRDRPEAQPFSIPLTELTSGKTYYYSANAYTTNPVNTSQVVGLVKSFTVPTTAGTTTTNATTTPESTAEGAGATTAGQTTTNDAITASARR